KVALAERDRGKRVDVVGRERSPSGEPHFNRGAGPRVRPGQAGRQRGRVVGDDQIARAQIVDDVRAARVTQTAERVDDEKLRVGRALVGLRRGNHGATPSWTGRAPAMASRISAAESSGRFSVDGSASGTAIA